MGKLSKCHADNATRKLDYPNMLQTHRLSDDEGKVRKEKFRKPKSHSGSFYRMPAQFAVYMPKWHFK
jgi:hypothetical protein